jgi:tetratricopeptide (TPR) repeat protein
MKKTAFILVVGMIFVLSCSDPGDPEKVLARARKYYEQGNYEKALQDYIWFHDNALKYKPSLYGVRLSFALLDWIELGKKYPKAHNELIDIRNRKSDLIKTKHGTQELFHDVKSINTYLNENQKTVDLYKEMTICDFDLAKQCYILAKDDLIAHQEFELCNQMMEAPMFIIRDMRKLLDQNISIYKTNQWADETHLEWSIKYYLEETECTLIVLVNNRRFVEADRFLAQAAEDIDIARIKSGLADLKNKYMPKPSTGG